LDAQENAILVHYVTETLYCDASGEVTRSESIPGQRKIKVDVSDLHRDNVPVVAREIVERSKIIHPSRTTEVEDLLTQLIAPPIPPASQPQPAAAAGPSSRQRGDAYGGGGRGGGECGELLQLPLADVGMLDDYLEKLYDEAMEEKVAGARALLSLCASPSSLVHLVEHESIVGVLSRVLRDEGRKSPDLAMCVVGIFLVMSHFTDLHALLNAHQVAESTVRLLEYENKRWLVRLQELRQKRQGIVDTTKDMTDDDKQKALELEERRFSRVQRRQSRLVYSAILTLLHLSEDIGVERQLVAHHSLIRCLVPVLDRSPWTHVELTMVALTYLKKMAIIGENKDEMRRAGVLPKLLRLVSCVGGGTQTSPFVLLLACRLLYNLAFDPDVRVELVEGTASGRGSVLKILTDLLKEPRYRQVSLRVLSQLTQDDRCKSLLTYHNDAIPMLLQLVIHFPEQKVGRDLVSVAVNLSTHPRAAEIMCDTKLMDKVVDRVMKTRDALLCKVVRNVARHDVSRPKLYEHLNKSSIRMSHWLKEFARLAQTSLDAPELLVELLGTLSSMSVAEIRWLDLEGLIDLIHKLLSEGCGMTFAFSPLTGAINEAIDDIVLECVMLCGTIAANDSEAMVHLASPRFLTLFQELLTAKQEDDEIVLQLLYLFHCFLMHDQTRDRVMRESEISQFLLDLLRDSNLAIRKQASDSLSIIVEFDPQLADKVKELKYQVHNIEWCQIVRREEQGEILASEIARRARDGNRDGGGHLADEEEEDEFDDCDGRPGFLLWDEDEALADRYWGDVLAAT